MIYKIEDFKKLNQPKKIFITQHSRKRFFERGISLKDVCKAIDNGEIIEQYPEDFPVPSCLILGNNNDNDKVIHVVASINDGIINLITAYIPDIDKWENDFKTRKEES